MKKLLLLTFIFLAAKVYSQSPVSDFTFELKYANCDLVLAHFYFDGSTSGDVDSCMWYFGDGVQKFSSHSNGADHNYSKPGIYSVELVVWKDGVMSSIKKDSIIHVYQPPEPSFSYEVSDTLLFAPLTVQFFNTTQPVDGDSLSYTWDIYRLDTFYTENPTITFSEPGTYSVLLKVNSQLGCEKNFVEQIIVKDSAQRGEFPLNLSECIHDSETSPCGYDKKFEIVNDTLVISGFYYGNCGTQKTATVNFSGDTVVVRIWEVGELTTCSCGYCFEIKVPEIYSDSVPVIFNGELKKARLTGIREKEIDTKEFSIYPNPAGNFLTVSYPERDGESLEYSIIDLLGVVKQSGNLEAGNQIIRLNRLKLSGGVYILSISNKGTHKFSEKLFVK